MVVHAFQKNVKKRKNILKVEDKYGKKLFNILWIFEMNMHVKSL